MTVGRRGWRNGRLRRRTSRAGNSRTSRTAGSSNVWRWDAARILKGSFVSEFNHKMARRVLACRDPSSKGFGEWDGALVIVDDLLVMFVDGRDFIGHPSYEDAQKMYIEYIDKGWVPMTREDLNETCYFHNMCYATGLHLVPTTPVHRACTKTRALARAMCVRIFRIFRRPTR